MRTPTAEETLRRAFRRGYTPPPRISVPTWADRYRQLAAESGSTRGPFQTSRVEVARGPMQAITEPGVRTITLMVCTQLLKTTVLENAAGYHAHVDPSPMLLLQPKEDAAKQFSKERIAPMIRRTPVLAAIMSGRRSRDEDTLLYKPFPGGFLALAGAGSPDNLARRPIRLLLADEIDKYPITREGDPIALAEERQATFDTNALSIRACSPTVAEESAIERSYADSDQRQASVECPRCGRRLFPDFVRNVEWDKRRRADGTVAEHLTATAGIVCDGCGQKWSEGERLLALRTIRWHQTRPFECCGQRVAPLDAYADAIRKGVENPVAAVWTWWDDPARGRWAVYRAHCPTCGVFSVPNVHAGFQASKLLSPWQRDRPRDIAKKWIAAQGDAARLQAFYNTQLGVAYRATTGRGLTLDALLARREVWEAEVPDGAGLITVAMDTQDYRVELETVAWGKDEESWSIDHTVIDGEFSDPEVQARVDQYLRRIWRDRFLRPYKVVAACLDSGGHHVQAVYAFCKDRISRHVWAIKGASEEMGQRNPVWPTKRPSRKTKASYRPIMIGGNAARDTVRQRLTMDAPGPGVRLPGYMHFPVDRDVGYFQQLLAERRELKTVNGRVFTIWVNPPGRANEASDLKVYNYAALCGLQHLGLSLNREVAKVLEAAPPSDMAPVVPEAPSPLLGAPPERKLSITQAADPRGKSLASRIA